MLPEIFAEQLLRVYSKRRDTESVRAIRSALRVWCQEHSCITPKVLPSTCFSQSRSSLGVCC